VAYRGRALVELDTTLGTDEIENEVSTIENEDVIRVQVTVDSNIYIWGLTRRTFFLSMLIFLFVSFLINSGN
jgi:hypothetical protein